MKKLTLLFLAIFTQVLTVLADDDIMITRDGSMMPVKVERISTSQVTFIDLKHKRRGRLNAPTDFVYMIMKEKGNNLFFDEEGNQSTVPVVKFDKKDNVLFLNNGKVFPIYNVSVDKDEITYQVKDKKNAPRYSMPKSDVFMVRNADGSNTLYNNKYQERTRQQRQEVQPTTPNVQAPPVSQPVPSAPQPTTSTTAPADTPSLLASVGVTETDFVPAPDMNAAELEMAVNAKNPYTLYRKGAMAEYCFQYKGKQTQWLPNGPTYLRQIVSDEKIENGLLVAYIQQELFNKKHEPSKGVIASYKESIFPVEIDTAGTYHLTHNTAKDYFVVSKRRGFGVLIPGQMTPGMQLKSSTLFDNVKNGLGGILKIETVYSDWKVVAEEKISTPAGTFDCVKLTGTLSQKQGSNGKFYKSYITCWLARGIGFVQYEVINETDKDKEPFIMYLNKLELK